MSFGKPLLVSDAIAQKRIVERVGSGLVHKERDIQDFTNRVIEIYTDKEAAKNFGKRGKDFIEKEFSWEITSNNLINLYERI